MPHRHLFLDDYEITRNVGLTRQVHRPDLHPGGAVLKPDTPWESRVSIYGTTLYDPGERLFKRWYLTGPGANRDTFEVRGRTVPGNVTLLGYATSRDGVHWDKPDLGQVSINGSKHNNIVDIGRSVNDDFVHWSEPERVFEYDAIDEEGTQFYGMPLDVYEGL